MQRAFCNLIMSEKSLPWEWKRRTPKSQPRAGVQLQPHRGQLSEKLPSKGELGSATTLIETSLNRDHEAAGIVCLVTPRQSTTGSFSPQVSVCTL